MLYTAAMISHRPTLDRITAFSFLEEAMQNPLKIKFENINISMSNADMEKLLFQGYYPIGVGQGWTYADMEFGSESSAIVHELRLINKLPQEDRVVDDLCRMMDRDNHDGYVSLRPPYAIGWIVRQAYRLGHDPDERAFNYSDEEVVNRAGHAIKMYKDTQRQLSGAKMPLALRERAKNARAMQLLPEGHAREHNGPLNISRYIRDMYVCGVSEDIIFDNAYWFIRVHNRAKERERIAEIIAKTHTFDQFLFPYHKETGTWVESNDTYLMAALLKCKEKRRDLVAMRSTRGNVIIKSFVFDLSIAAQQFIKKEPGLWIYRHNILANGTESVDVTATGCSRKDIEFGLGASVMYKRD